MKTILLVTSLSVIILLAGFSSVASAEETLSIQDLRETIIDICWTPGHYIKLVIAFIWGFFALLLFYLGILTPGGIYN